MAVHTYIGARYVPRFMGTYDATQMYEALDVVDNGSGTSYIAKKTVPPGTPLTDTDYWFVYGASSGAIVQLQNDMIQAQNDILGLDSDVTALQDNAHREILVIGNSYVQQGCATQIEAIFDQAYEKTYGGAGFADFTGHPTTFETLLDQAIADASIDKDKITDILFVSAHGDTAAYTEHGYSTYLGKVATTFGNIQGKISNNFPNIRKVSITLGESRNQKYYTGSTFDSMFRVHGIFASYAPRYGFDYIGWSGFNLLFESSFFQGDNTHLNSAGSYVLGNLIKSSYFGKLIYTPKSVQSTTLPFLYTANATCVFNVSYTPEETNFSLGQSSQSATEAVTLTANNPIINCDHTSLRIGCPPPASPFPSHGPLVTSGATWAAQENLYLGITGDSNGIMEIISYMNMTKATAAYAHFAIPHLHYTYKNY